MQIAIFSKYPTKETLTLTRGIISFLKTKKITVILNKKLAKSLNSDEKHPVFSSFVNKKNIQNTPPVFSEKIDFFDFLGNLLVTLKTIKNYNLQANFQKMEKSCVCLPLSFSSFSTASL